MYIDGRLRTASSPSRTWMLSAVYAGAAAAAAARPDRLREVGRVSDSVICSPNGQSLVEPAEVFVVVVLDRYPSTLSCAAERHLCSKRIAQAALQLLHVGADQW